MIVHAHTAYGDWMSPLLKWALGQADAIVAVSDFAARSYLEAGYRSDRVRVVHNALDISGWDPSIDAAPVRAELGIKPDELVVGIVGRMYRWKGHGDLLNAVAMVSQNVPGVKVLVVVQDDVLLNEGRSYKADLEEQARRLGISSRVVFAGFRKDVDRLVAAMDVFALPSWGDSFGMVYLEAMAMNKPCVAWTAGGAPEVIETGRTGYVVPTGDVAALAKALDALLVSPELRQRFGEEGRRRAETVFTPQRMSESMLSVYRSVLGRTQTSSATGRAALA